MQTIVMITPHVIRAPRETVSAADRQNLQNVERVLRQKETELAEKLPLS